MLEEEFRWSNPKDLCGASSGWALEQWAPWCLRSEVKALYIFHHELALTLNQTQQIRGTINSKSLTRNSELITPWSKTAFAALFPITAVIVSNCPNQDHGPSLSSISSWLCWEWLRHYFCFSWLFEGYVKRTSLWCFFRLVLLCRIAGLLARHPRPHVTSFSKSRPRLGTGHSEAAEQSGWQIPLWSKSANSKIYASQLAGNVISSCFHKLSKSQLCTNMQIIVVTVLRVLKKMQQNM